MKIKDFFKIRPEFTTLLRQMKSSYDKYVVNVQAGDYYIPDLKLPEEERPIGKYGRMHREYLRENNPMLFNDLVLSCQLWTYLADINEQAQDRLQIIISQMQKAEFVTEKMKEDNQWEWIQRMGSIHNRAEEIVLNELIYR